MFENSLSTFLYELVSTSRFFEKNKIFDFFTHEDYENVSEEDQERNHDHYRFLKRVKDSLSFLRPIDEYLDLKKKQTSRYNFLKRTFFYLVNHYYYKYKPYVLLYKISNSKEKKGVIAYVLLKSFMLTLVAIGEFIVTDLIKTEQYHLELELIYLEILQRVARNLISGLNPREVILSFFQKFSSNGFFNIIRALKGFLFFILNGYFAYGPILVLIMYTVMENITTNIPIQHGRALVKNIITTNRIRKRSTNLELEKRLNNLPEQEFLGICSSLYSSLSQVSYFLTWFVIIFYSLQKLFFELRRQGLGLNAFVFLSFGNILLYFHFYVVSQVLAYSLIYFTGWGDSSNEKHVKAKRNFWEKRVYHDSIIYQSKQKRDLIINNNYFNWVDNSLKKATKQLTKGFCQLEDLSSVIRLGSSFCVYFAVYFAYVYFWLFWVRTRLSSFTNMILVIQNTRATSSIANLFFFFCRKMLKDLRISVLLFYNLLQGLFKENFERERLICFLEEICLMDSLEKNDLMLDFCKKDLRVKNFSVGYYTREEDAKNPSGFKAVVQVKDFNVVLGPQEKIVLKAPSGYGKSLLLTGLKGIGGCYVSGSVFLGDKEISLNNLHKYTYKVPSSIDFLNISLRQNFNLINYCSDQEIRNLFCNYGFNRDLNLEKIYNINSFSEGQKKRLALIRMECELKNKKGNSLLLLDECFSNLDEENLLVVISRIKQLEYPAIIVSHEKIVHQNFKVLELS